MPSLDQEVTLSTSRFDADLAHEWDRYPPPNLDLVDVMHSRAACARHFQRVRSRPGERRIGVTVAHFSIPSLTDDHCIPLRVYRPASAEKARGLLYLHGGAFVLGDLDLEEEKCIAFARGAGCAVVSVDYRLAPEHPHPTPLEDCYSALCWVADHSDTLAIDTRPLAVGGCSAGGALAAGLAQLSRDRNGPALALQMLLYPVLDASLGHVSTRVDVPEDELRDLQRMWKHYLGGPKPDADWYASPLECPDLKGLPPAYIVAGELDALRDEAIAYGQRLLMAGVSVELHVWPRTPHAVDLFAPDASISRRSVRQQVDALTRVLG